MEENVANGQGITHEFSCRYCETKKAERSRQIKDTKAGGTGIGFKTKKGKVATKTKKE